MGKKQTFSKEVEVLYDVDVLVVGCGVAGMIAAIAAAREGADTLVIDRYGQPGGNMGPGNVIGAPSLELPKRLAGGIPGISGELIAACEEMTGHTFLYNYFEDSQTFSYLVLKEYEKQGVKTLFNIYAGDPIMEGETVKGLFVETKQGTKALLAKVVIDCTGDADVVVRSGAPYDDGNSMVHSGCYYALGNVDVDLYKHEVIGKQVPEELFDWFRENVHPRLTGGHSRQLIPFLKNAADAGEPFVFVREGRYGYISADHGLFWGVSGFSVDDPHKLEKYGIVGGIMGLQNQDGKYFQDTGDSVLMTEIEHDTRKYIVELARFLKKYVPGFDNSYLHYIGAYYHGRGGRSMLPAHQLSEAEVTGAACFDDVVFEGHYRHIHPASNETTYELWDVVHDYRHTFEWPYRQFLPRNVEGLLCAGRAAIVQPPVLRMRWQMLMCGEVAGRAAARAVQEKVPPRDIDVAALRKTLYETGFPMGDDPTRIEELGLR